MQFFICSICCTQNPPPLDVPLELIGKESKAKDAQWDDEGALAHSMEVF